MTETGSQIPLKNGLWANPSDGAGKPRLIASRCEGCHELFFPKKENELCSYCQSEHLNEVLLSNIGKIFSFTIVMQRPPTFYQGEVPYAIGFVELPEGIRVETLFTGCRYEDLSIGMPVEMIVDRLHLDDGDNEILTYKFQPTST